MTAFTGASYLTAQFLRYQPFSTSIGDLTAQPTIGTFLKGSEKILFINTFLESVKDLADNFGSIASSSATYFTAFTADEIDLFLSGQFFSTEKQTEKTTKLFLSTGCKMTATYVSPLTPIANKMVCSAFTSVATELIKTKGDLSTSDAIYKAAMSSASSFVKESLLGSIFSKTSLLPHFAGLATDITLSSMKSSIIKFIKSITSGKADIDHINLPYNSTYIDFDDMSLDNHDHIKALPIESHTNIDETHIKVDYATDYTIAIPTDDILTNPIDAFIAGETMHGEFPDMSNFHL